jgi:hypothetical protein
LHIVRVFRDDGEYAWGSDIVNAVSFFVLFCAKGR